MEDKAEGQNHRKSERVDAAFTLTYTVGDSPAIRVNLGLFDEIDALMLNLSDLGVALITKYNIPVGTQLYIKFNIIDLRLVGEERRKHIEVIGKVVSNVPLASMSHRIGIHFEKISERDKAAIRDFAKRGKFPSESA